MIAVMLFVILWFISVFALSFSGQLERLPPVALVGFGAFVPTAGFRLLYLSCESLQRFFRTRSLRLLTWAQVLRFFGVLAFFKARDGVLPEVFALPTGVIDVVFAITALWAAKHLVSPEGRPLRGFVAWHMLGLVGLAVSITLGFLTSSATLPLVHDGITTQPMRHFPISLVPAFIGPMVLLCHVFAIAAAKMMRRDDPRSARV